MTENEKGTKEYNEHVKEDAGRSESKEEQPEKKSLYRKMFGGGNNKPKEEEKKQSNPNEKKKSFTEKIKDKFRRKNKNKTGFDNPPYKATTTKDKKSTNKGKNKRHGYGSNGGAKYTSLFGTRLDEGAVPGGDFIDPYAVEHEVRGNREKSPFALSVGSPPPPMMNMGRMPSPELSMGRLLSPDEMMGWKKPRKGRR